MSGLWSRWVEQCFRPVDARILAALRISLATITVFDLLRTWAQGLVPWLYRIDHVGFSAPERYYLLESLGPDGPVYAFWVAVGAYALVALGVFTRPAILVAVLASAQLGQVGALTEQGVDRVVRTTMLILLFAPSDARWAVGPSKRQDHIPAWPLDLTAFLLVLIYMDAGFCKLFRDWNAWTNLASTPATYRIMADPLSGVVDPVWGYQRLWLFRALDTFTLLFECLAFFLVTRFRAAWAVMGVVLHVGLALTMKLGQFPYLMLAYYPMFFVPEPAANQGADALRQLVERVQAARGT
jgi:hypothetical protein